MKKLSIALILCMAGIFAFSQFSKSDSLQAELKKELPDTTRIKALAALGSTYLFTSPITGLNYIQQGLDLARKITYPNGEAMCLNALGHNYRMTGNFSKSLKAHFEALKIYESANDSLGMTLSYRGISGNYEDQEEFKESLLYAYKAKLMAESIHNSRVLIILQSNMGNCYEKMGQLDSALKYAQNAYQLSITDPNSSKGIILGRLGNIHAKMGNDALAVNYYHLGILNALENADLNALTEIYYGLALLYEKQGQTDSCIYYAKKTMATGKIIANPTVIVEASTLLFNVYKKKIETDSAFKYLEMATVIKDTLINQDKFKQIQLLAYEEKNRQQEINEKKLQAVAERNINIQYAAIAVALITFLIVFMLLSRTIIVNERWITFSGIVALLLVFEFINLIIHPYLAAATHESPVLMLSGLVVIAAILVPVHHRLEQFVQQIIVTKNKRIRLAAARKTIAKLAEDKDE